ncbi:putative beta-lysine N-acetyltransferase [Evansella tamaricis]|uniref:Beta-lysine N-acetyltransferase n=1 Tax=Evansella tamaricis TaxID=2069301 RepID=A0ABS6JC97_9BACI|nr:putative beta-lysine N-acetyltransferase [Evansella tamaricis]MBU9711298.1 putative beta-lysine N-acetyltransferase [Evansella tamaricis]
MKNQWDKDVQNDRIVGYLPNLNNIEVNRIMKLMEQDSPGKFIIYTLSKYKDILLNLGFSLESKLSGFFHGDEALIFTKYHQKDRLLSKTAKENKEVLSIVKGDTKEPCEMTHGFQIELVKDVELEELARLFQTVFPIYPTNIFDPDYLQKVKDSEEYMFMVAKDDNGIIGAASAMNTGYQSAEITDCAVHPDYRGKNLLNAIVMAIEKELVKKRIYHSFSLTRAKSVGMNMTVKRLNYRYEGTLINNCIISTGFEDMNIWTKKLKG